MGTVSEMDVGIVETDEYPFITEYLISEAEFIEGPPRMKGGLKQCVMAAGCWLLIASRSI